MKCKGEVSRVSVPRSNDSTEPRERRFWLAFLAGQAVFGPLC